MAELKIDITKAVEENQQSLEKRDKMLRDTVAELVEAKRLLKAAVEDIHKKCLCEGKDCDICINEKIACDYDDRFAWRHEAEALKLIGDDMKYEDTDSV